ncbi:MULTISPECIES: hypothetical protein [unclassified Bradyrhizobium]|uniref:hypothetical protein n=1 Tax=unclassified Bradyrhizobium TaxID=2631580 RepID=UPI0029166BC0|nr:MULTISPECIES: hypothetical protein [unclassified Bradyrhizobium]
MIGVRFIKDVRPHGVGDTRLLPESVAEALVDAGEAELFAFPEAPHAHEAGYVTKPMPPKVTKPMQPMKPGKGR